MLAIVTERRHPYQKFAKLLLLSVFYFIYMRMKPDISNSVTQVLTNWRDEIPKL